MRPVVLFLLLIFLLTACESGAVVFAPTPLPPDVSPLSYEHPSGAFTITVPRTWAIYEQYTTTLATAAFYPAGEDQPLIVVAAVKLEDTLDSPAFSVLLNRYQTEIRPDSAHYKEESREAMGDGSWRMGGLRLTAGGITQQLNTFIQLEGVVLGIVEVILPQQPSRLAEVQAAVNSFALNAENGLEATEAQTLARVARSPLEIMNVSTWQTPAGVFYITGEIANTGTTPVSNIPIRAELVTQDGLPVAEALDTAMGYGIQPGGFAPFSLRFGQGQPSLSAGYTLQLGNAEWQLQPDTPFIANEALRWTDESEFTADGALIITGTVTNISDTLVREVRAVVTIFDTEQRVTAAAFANARPAELAPDEEAVFEFIITEYGQTPANYIVNVQGMP